MLASLRIPLVAAVALLAAAGDARSQDFRTAVGYGGGGVLITPLNAGQGGAARELRLETGWIMSAEIENRLDGGWLGLRVHGAYTQRPFMLPNRTLAINAWFADAGVLLRPFAAGNVRGVSPFLSIGAGLVKYSFGRGAAVEFEQANARYPGDRELLWAGVVGVGLDLGPVLEIQETPLGFRIEAADHVALRSPFDPIAGDRFSPIHNIRVTFSLLSMIGELPGPP